MSWFKVDDHLHSHRKTMRAGTEAMGLWVLAGSWSGAEESDGWVPSYVVARLVGADRAEPLATLLVTAGLWSTDTVDGEDGYRFRGWEDYQPTREQLEAKRADARERMRRARSQGGDVRANSERTARAVTPTPTRPDPTPSEARKRATQLPDGFTPNDANRRIAEERGLDLRAVLEQFSDHHRAKGTTYKDWHAALNTWLRREQPTLPGAGRVQQHTVPQSQRVTVNHCGDTTAEHNAGGRHRWDDGTNHYLCPGA